MEGDPLPFPVDYVPIYEAHAEKYPLIDRILNSSSQHDLTIIDAPSHSPATTRILSIVSDYTNQKRQNPEPENETNPAQVQPQSYQPQLL